MKHSFVFSTPSSQVRRISSGTIIGSRLTVPSFLLRASDATLDKLRSANLTLHCNFWKTTAAELTDVAGLDQPIAEDIIVQRDLFKAEKWDTLGDVSDVVVKVLWKIPLNERDLANIKKKQEENATAENRRGSQAVALTRTAQLIEDAGVVNRLLRIRPTTPRTLSVWCRLIHRIAHDAAHLLRHQHLTSAQRKQDETENNNNNRKDEAVIIKHLLQILLSCRTTVTDADSVRSFCSLFVTIPLHVCDCRESFFAQLRIANESSNNVFIESLCTMAPLATTPEAVTGWVRLASAILARYNATQNRDFHKVARDVRDGFIITAPFARTAVSAHSWCSAVWEVVKTDYTALHCLFATEQMRDALIKVEPYATTSDSASWWANCVRVLTMSNRPAQRLFSTQEVHDCLIRTAKFIDNGNDVLSFCCALACVAQDRSVQTLWSTPEVRDTLLRLGTMVDSCGVCQWWCSALFRVAGRSTAFASSQVLQTLLSILPPRLEASEIRHTRNAESVHSWISALRTVTHSLYRHGDFRSVLMTSGGLTRQLHAAMVQFANRDVCDAECAGHWTSVMSNLTCTEIGLAVHFVSPEMADAFVAVVKFLNVEGCRWWARALANLTAALDVNTDRRVTVAFSTEAMRDAILRSLVVLVRGMRTHRSPFVAGRAAELCLAAIQSILRHARAQQYDEARRHFATERMSRMMTECFGDFANTTHGLMYWLRCFRILTATPDDICGRFVSPEQIESIVACRPGSHFCSHGAPWIGAVGNAVRVARPDSLKLLLSREVVESFISVGRNNVIAIGAITWCNSVSTLLRHGDDQFKLMFACEEVREVFCIVHRKNHLGALQPVMFWIAALSSVLSIKNDAQSVFELFATKEVAEALGDIRVIAQKDTKVFSMWRYCVCRLANVGISNRVREFRKLLQYVKETNRSPSITT